MILSDFTSEWAAQDLRGMVMPASLVAASSVSIATKRLRRSHALSGFLAAAGIIRLTPPKNVDWILFFSAGATAQLSFGLPCMIGATSHGPVMIIAARFAVKSFCGPS